MRGVLLGYSVMIIKCTLGGGLPSKLLNESPKTTQRRVLWYPYTIFHNKLFVINFSNTLIESISICNKEQYYKHE